jgi:hypothetical protein
MSLAEELSWRQADNEALQKHLTCRIQGIQQ